METIWKMATSNHLEKATSESWDYAHSFPIKITRFNRTVSYFEPSPHQNVHAETVAPLKPSNTTLQQRRNFWPGSKAFFCETFRGALGGAGDGRGLQGPGSKKTPGESFQAWEKYVRSNGFTFFIYFWLKFAKKNRIRHLDYKIFRGRVHGNKFELCVFHLYSSFCIPKMYCNFHFYIFALVCIFLVFCILCFIQIYLCIFFGLQECVLKPMLRDSFPTWQSKFHQFSNHDRTTLRQRRARRR